MKVSHKLTLTPEQREHMLAWVEALESGKYKQTKQRLRDNLGMCCLGVACDVYAKATGTTWDHDYGFMGEKTKLPFQVMDWLGLEHTDPQLYDPTMPMVVASASRWNDSYDASFRKIAAMIRANYHLDVIDQNEAAVLHDVL